MEELLELIKTLEDKTGHKNINISLYSDGTGLINVHYDLTILFKGIEELKESILEFQPDDKQNGI